MRAGRSLFLMPVLAILLASCSSPFRVAGAGTFGRVDDISVADIQAAVSVYRALIVDHDQAIGPIEVISHYVIRGRADITDAAERRALVQALARGARDATPNMMHACFNPRHGLRVERGSYAVDFVICFECLQVQASGFQPADFFLTSAAPQPTFDESLRHHNLPLPEK
jgi:hypothetical protein